jgi:hypothetical protein
MKKLQSALARSEEARAYVSLLHELRELPDELTAFENPRSPTIQKGTSSSSSRRLQPDPLSCAEAARYATLQHRLATAGLSRLGRMESQVLCKISVMINLCGCALGANSIGQIAADDGPTWITQLGTHTNNLFGKPS